MPAASPAIIALLATFAPAFSTPTFAHALVLVYGTILAPGRRTGERMSAHSGIAAGHAHGPRRAPLSRAT
jgi:hypothetical protein